MSSYQVYIAVVVIALAVVAILAYFSNKGKTGNRLTPLATIAFGFMLAGIFSTSFVYNRLLTYSLYGVAVVIAVIDIFRKRKSK